MTLIDNQQRLVMMPNGQQSILKPKETQQQNPYADRAATQEEVAKNSQAVVEQQPNIFAQQKSVGYSSSAQPQQPVVEQKPAPVVQQPQVQKQQTQPVLDSNSSSAGMDYLNSLYTDPREEERLRKASVMNQRILAIGDAIRHIGNIANTVNYAPAQQFNSPVQEEYARYERGKALRDRANQQYYTYQQQKAAQDAAQKKWEAEQNYKLGLLNHYKEQESRLRDKDAVDKENKEAKRDLDRDKFETDKAFKEGKLSIAQYNAQTSRIRAVKSGRAGGGGGKYWAYDQDGNIHYYPNRTMWEQGIYQFSGGMPQTETLTSTNASGQQTQRQVGKKPTKTGGYLARNANKGKGGNTAFSNFSIHK